MEFDARRAKAMAPGEKLALKSCPGLRLEVSKTGVKAWIYRYKSPATGQMKQTKIGEWPATSYAAALGEWENLRQRRGGGEDIAAEKKRKRAEEAEAARVVAEAERIAAYTVRELCDDYWEQHIKVNRKDPNPAQIKGLFARELGPVANFPAVNLTRNQAFDLIRGVAERAPRTAKSLRLELGAAWNHAIDGGKIPDTTPNWWGRVLKGKIRDKGRKIGGVHQGAAKRVLSPKEIGDLLRWLPNYSTRVSDVLTLYLWTGTRGSEIVTMEGREVAKEADGWWWQIPKAKTKNARFEKATDLRVPLVGRALDIVLRRKERYGDGYLFPSKLKPSLPATQHSIGSGVFWHMPYCTFEPEKPRVRSTVTHWTPHDLRRTARTTLASLGCPKEVAEVILGHLLEGVEGIYNLYRYDKERREWLEKLASHYEDLANP